MTASGLISGLTGANLKTVAAKALERPWRMLAVAAAIGTITLVFMRLPAVTAATAGIMFLLTILMIGVAWGFRDSIFGSFLATYCFTAFFFPPVGAFCIATPLNGYFFAFLGTSLIASSLSQRARSRAAEAVYEREEAERLYSLSQMILLAGLQEPFCAQIVQDIARIYRLQGAAIFDGRSNDVSSAGRPPSECLTRQLRETAASGAPWRDAQAQVVVVPVTLAADTMGSLALQGSTLSDSHMRALVNLVAIGLERVRAQEAAARAEAARHSEEFKSTLLDALAHEFKTPLTSVKAATSAILCRKVREPEHQHELLTVIDQEASRLDTLVTEAIQISRIEAGNLVLHKDLVPVSGLVRTVLEQMSIALDGRSVQVSIADALPPVSVDPNLMELALKQLVDNAAKYSPPDSPISVRAESGSHHVRVSVADEGGGIPEAERARIFERFFRGQRVRSQVAGSGMGLAIAREILEAHGGTICAESSFGLGSKFILEIPLVLEEVNP